jgi:hypothetical protein
MPGATEAFTSAGTTLALSATLPASLSASAYGVPVYTLIGEVTDAGSLGRTYAVVNHQPLATRGTVKLKGSFDDGTMTVQMAYAPGNAGQVLLETALDDDDFYAFKMVLQDGTIKFFQAMVTSDPVNVGTVDTVTGATVNLAVKSGTIITVLPG